MITANTNGNLIPLVVVGYDFRVASAKWRSNMVTRVVDNDSFAARLEAAGKVVVNPARAIEAAMGGKLLGLVFFCILFGYFLTRIEPGYAKPVIGFWQGVFQVMMRMTEFVMRLAPIGVFGLAARTVESRLDVDLHLQSEKGFGTDLGFSFRAFESAAEGEELLQKEVRFNGVKANLPDGLDGEVAAAVLGPDATSGSWGRDRVGNRQATIAGGTTQINKNIIAQRVLGLPRG